MTGVTPETKRIELGLDQTRSKLNTHLAELQGRLSPGQVVDDLMAYFRGKEGAEFGRNLLGSVHSNPLPAAITGIGLAWLMASKPRPGASAPGSAPTGSSRVRVYRGAPDLDPNLEWDSYGGMTARLRDAERGVAEEHGEAKAVYAARLEDARGQAIGLSRHTQETSASYSQRIRDTLAWAQEAVTHGAHDLRDQVGDAASSAGSTAQGALQGVSEVTQRAGGAVTHGAQAGSNLITTFSESPVLLGALGLAAGALLGALLPQSKQEEAALGDIAGQARDTARSLAQEGVDKGGHVARIVLDKGRDSAEAQGLTGSKSAGQLVDAAMSGELAGSVKQVATDVLQTTDETVRKEVLGEGKEAVQPS